MDKHDKHHKPGKSHAKTGVAAVPAVTEALAPAINEKGKGDWAGKQQDSKKSR